MFLVVLLVSVVYGGCHPQCTCGGTGTAYTASCVYVLNPQQPVCNITCGTPPPNYGRIVCEQPVCMFTCPPSQCETSQCPACTTLCQPKECVFLPVGGDASSYCTIACQAPNPTWSCRTPAISGCSNITCDALTCGSYSASSTLMINSFILLLLVLVAMTM